MLIGERCQRLLKGLLFGSLERRRGQQVDKAFVGEQEVQRTQGGNRTTRNAFDRLHDMKPIDDLYVLARPRPLARLAVSGEVVGRKIVDELHVGELIAVERGYDSVAVSKLRGERLQERARVVAVYQHELHAAGDEADFYVEAVSFAALTKRERSAREVGVEPALKCQAVPVVVAAMGQTCMRAPFAPERVEQCDGVAVPDEPDREPSGTYSRAQPVSSGLHGNQEIATRK